jgi:hypothetical protein
MVLTKQYKAAISLLMISRNKVLYYLKAKKKVISRAAEAGKWEYKPAVMLPGYWVRDYLQ